MHASGKEAGFTLLEVLAAFVIALLALSVLLNSASSSVLMSRTANQMDEAVSRAQSHLEAITVAPLVPGDRQGDDGHGFHWHVVVIAAGAVTPSHSLIDIPPGTVTLYRVSVVITWMEGDYQRAVRLHSARLGPVA